MKVQKMIKTAIYSHICAISCVLALLNDSPEVSEPLIKVTDPDKEALSSLPCHSMPPMSKQGRLVLGFIYLWSFVAYSLKRTDTHGDKDANKKVPGNS